MVYSYMFFLSSLLPQTLFSLSKLALLASSEDDKEVKVQQLNDELHHIQVQQSLPTDVLEVGVVVGVAGVWVHTSCVEVVPWLCLAIEGAD